MIKAAATVNRFRENTVFFFVFEKNTHRTATKTFEGKKDANELFGVSLRLIPQFILGLAKYLVYCLTVIWLTINNNTGRLLKSFATRFRIGNVAKEWIWVTTVLAFVLLSSYGCEDFDAPEKDSGTSSRSSAGETTTSAANGLESDAGRSNEMDSGQAQVDAEAPAVKTDEKPLKTDFVVAQSSEDFIFIPNPRNHCVTVIDGVSLIKAEWRDVVRCVPCKNGQCVGNNPTYLGVHPTKSPATAIVVDKGTRYAAVIQQSRSTEIITRFEVAKGANAIRFAPGGRHAIVYYDPAYVGDADEVGNYQEVTVVSIENLSSSEDEDVQIATNMIVGSRPRKLVFQDNGSKAFFVTDDGISIVNLGEIDSEDSSTIATTVDFEGRLDPKDAQIVIAPGGRFAFGFEPGSNELFQLDIGSAIVRMEASENLYSLIMNDFFLEAGANGENGNGNGISDDDDAGRSSPVYDFDDEDKIDPRTELPEDVVPGITDVAINPAGKDSFIMVTIPNPGLVLKMSIPEAFKPSNNPLDHTDFYLVDEEYDRVVISIDISNSGEIVGQKAWLYNREEKSLRTVLLDLTGKAPPAVKHEDWKSWAFNHIKYVNVAQPISSAEAFENDNAIIAFHEPTSAVRSATKGIGYSIINLDEGAARFTPTSRPVDRYITYNNAFFAKTIDDPLSPDQRIFRTGLIDLLSETIELKSKPNAIGVMGGENIKSIFVSHEHPDGHIILMSDEGEVVTNPFIGFQIVNRVQRVQE